MSKYNLVLIIYWKFKNYISMGKKKKCDYILYYVATNLEGRTYLEKLLNISYINSLTV